MILKNQKVYPMIDLFYQKDTQLQSYMLHGIKLDGSQEIN